MARAVTAGAAVLAAAALLACASAPASTPTAGAGPAPARPPGEPQDDDQAARAGLVPAGFGTLRQEDVSVNVQLLGVAVRALPLEESVLRVLSPDSYRALRDLARSRQGAIDAVARRYGVVRPSLWYVQFFGVQQGEARFSPLDVVISSAGRDFRPLDVVPVTPGFGEGRIAQRQTQAAIYVFDGGLDPNQPLLFSFQTARDDSWATTLRRIESERTLARARAAAASGTRTDSTRRVPR